MTRALVAHGGGRKRAATVFWSFTAEQVFLIRRALWAHEQEHEQTYAPCRPGCRVCRELKAAMAVLPGPADDAPGGAR